MHVANEPAIRIRDLTKTFGTVRANQNVSIDLYRGEILALLGENGSGKTTLVNMLSGIYFPDSGEIFIDGREVVIRSPKDAFALGIGMVHQHFKLVDVLSAAENIVLGLPGGTRVSRAAIADKIKDIAGQYGFDIDPWKKIYNMSVSEKQTVEIIKVLYRGAGILILDEPTAVLTPQETGKLFDVLRRMKSAGKAVIIITHKLGEVLAISDRVSILRRGECAGTVNTVDATVQSLTESMVGRAVSLAIRREQPENTAGRLAVTGLTCLDPAGRRAMDGVSFTLRAGEILGVAGIAGSGQKELCESLTGLRAVNGGSIAYIGEDGDRTELTGLSPAAVASRGIHIAFVPEDRLGMGLVAGLDMVDNMMLKSYRSTKGILADRKTPKAAAEDLIKRLDIVTPGTSTPVGRLSGGNVQKVLLGREIGSEPSVLIAAYPTRGLDIHSTYTVYELLGEQKKKGVAVIFVGEDLDVLLALCDRILVLHAGRVSGLVDARPASKEEIGLMMTHNIASDGGARREEGPA